MRVLCAQEIGRASSTGAASAVAGAGPAGAAGPGSACPAITKDREGYALAAGFALGLITLGTGRSAVGLHDLNLEVRLRWVPSLHLLVVRVCLCVCVSVCVCVCVRASLNK